MTRRPAASNAKAPASAPAAARDTVSSVSEQTRDITAFLYEIGQLKRYPRTGWLTAGVPGPESVADHCYRASVIAAVIAVMEGADPQRAAFLALWHDSQETRTTDLSHLTKKYVTPASNAEVTSAQVARLPAALANLVSAAVAEYEARQTPEARCARDADKIDLLLQAREYTGQGHPGLRPFIDSALAALQTAAARELAAEALRQGFLDWLDRALGFRCSTAGGGHYDPAEDESLLLPGVVATAAAAVASLHLGLQQERATSRGSAQSGYPLGGFVIVNASVVQAGEGENGGVGHRRHVLVRSV